MIKGFAAESPVLRPYEKLLDFFHATEHLSKAAEAMCGEKLIYPIHISINGGKN
jgi:hypothetical protein